VSRQRKRGGKRKPLSAWHYWQHAITCLEAIAEEMQCVAACIAQEPAIALPGYQVRQIRRDLERFEDKFLLMAREQKRKAASR
jgi:hypothetical protein